MAFAQTHAIWDDELIVFWDHGTKEATVVTLSKGEPIDPHYPSASSEVIFAGCGDDAREDAERQIARWKAAYGVHLRLVPSEER